MHRSVKDLEKAIYEYIDANNQDSKPFVWTKSAEQILEKVERAKRALSKQQTV